MCIKPGADSGSAPRPLTAEQLVAHQARLAKQNEAHRKRLQRMSEADAKTAEKAAKKAARKKPRPRSTLPSGPQVPITPPIIRPSFPMPADALSIASAETQSEGGCRVRTVQYSDGHGGSTQPSL